MAGKRILVVEDEPAVARGLEYALAREGYAVLWAKSGAQALDLARSRDPHLVLLDIRLPDLSGFDVCRQLRAEGRRMPVLMLTARDEETDIVLGLELGADDYVVKPFNLRQLLSRVRALLRRAYGEYSAPGGETQFSFGPVVVDLAEMRVARGGHAVDLTPIEFRLLRQLVSHPNRPLTRERLIEDVWGYDSAIGSTRTVDVHMRHLRQKLEEDPSQPRWLVTVRGVGYKLQT